MSIRDFPPTTDYDLEKIENVFVETSLSKNVSKLEELIRELRKNLFLRTQYSHAPERVWEEEEQVEERMNINKLKRQEWDIETEKMIQDCK